MLYINSSDFVYKDSATVVTIGNFDGFHRGHRVLIKKINKLKWGIGAKSLAFSFNPRPKDVFNNIPSKSILSLEERIGLAKSIDIDIFVEYPFSLEFSRMSGEDFIKNIIIGQFNCKQIVVGASFTFGKDRAWDTAKIQEIGHDLKVPVEILPHKLLNDEKISSTAIREHLRNGEITKANELLGYDYFLIGIMNKTPEKSFAIQGGEGKILPKNGIYITETRLADGTVYPSITNIYNDTCVQTQISGFSGGFFGEETVTTVFKRRS